MSNKSFGSSKSNATKTTECLVTWQCIGCGNLEAPQACIGMCQDRKVELVDAREFDRLCELLETPRALAQAFRGVLSQRVRATPRDGDLDCNYRALQEQAHKTLAKIADGAKSEREAA